MPTPRDCRQICAKRQTRRADERAEALVRLQRGLCFQLAQLFESICALHFSERSNDVFWTFCGLFPDGFFQDVES
jgi:hypothetical protein